MYVRPGPETVQACRNFEKYLVMHYHRQQERLIKSCGNTFQGLPFLTRDPPGVSPAEALRQTAPLSSLREIELRQMTVDHTHRGYVLYGKLCVPGYTATVIHTVLEDTTGRGIAMMICHDSDDVVEKCRFGQKVAVKEPYLMTTTDGRISLRVENPKDVEVVTTFPSEAIGESEAGKDVGTGGPTGASNDGDGWLDDGFNLCAPPDFLRREGNRQFADRNFKRAIAHYGYAIRSCDEFSKEEKASGWTDSQLSTEYVLAYSNRAEAWLRLGKYKEALVDCAEALKRDPTHRKSMVREEKARSGLKGN